MTEQELLEYRTTRDFQRASKDILALLQKDLNGQNVRRANDARAIFEFVSLLLVHARRTEEKSNSRAAELLKVKGQVEFLSKRVIVASPEKHEFQGEKKEGDADGHGLG
jgi:hypothetical protein